MLFDDRLATVLRFPAQSELAARTQYRQLLDLLGSMPADAPSALSESAFARLGDLADELPAAMQSAILRSPGLRLRNPKLVAWLAQSEPQAAAAVMATAQLTDSDWVELIPRLPLMARGFLRHRRELPPGARQVLDRLGVKDLVLPEPERVEPAVEEQDPGIGALVRRIEAFQNAKRKGPTAPRLPLGDGREFDHEHFRRSRAFDFSTDAQGVITWADPAMAPMVVGLALGPMRPDALAVLDETGARTMSRRLPLRGASLTLQGTAEIAGEWRIDAAPVFSPEEGRFTGYSGRMRRPLPVLASAPVPAVAPSRTGGSGDRMRQLLHELRTPANAIQGFAEMIQQQMFGTTPNEYRALAAAVAVDAARIMAGFDEIDRLARLEAGALEFEGGQCDLREVVNQLLRRLDGVLRQRSARIEFEVEGPDFIVGLSRNDALQLIWRLLATLAGALAPGEFIDLNLTGGSGQVTMEIDIPGSMMGDTDLFAATATAQPRAVSAGMFGSGFTFRLARAEARAAGGELERQEDRLCLVLPSLTDTRVTLDRRI
ncbi:MAG: HAMP domain-containing histidine kinase [Porphyrobacter sp.]|nr:HAMP domain-containing histidine kinase [Porphyrobacter sp.]